MNHHDHDGTPGSARNLLAGEKSPYLLQHAANPVDWHPWSDAAFGRARAENKPVLVSIGYSTCHWCHVMERESFEDPEVADRLNRAFVNVKVDREERPDLDAAYLAAAQMLGSRGGWPLTIIMTPDRRPFFAATYIPKQTGFGRVGLLDLIPALERAWQNDRGQIEELASRVAAELARVPAESGAAELGEGALHAAFQQLSALYDPEHGGFGRSQKFPTPHLLFFLMRYFRRTGEAQALEMAERTLTAMSQGGIHDHLGFGFHRYSTDPEWLLPHFEKMLYDQALLIIAFLDAYLITGKEDYARTARRTIEYVLRDLGSPEGAFYSAEDADSEGKEGEFYLWTESEVKSILGVEDGELFTRVYEFGGDGNFLEEASQARSGRNIPHLGRPLSAWARELSLGEEELERRLEAARKKLFEARQKRVRPSRDDKVLTDWNGLMIAALARAGRALEDDRWIEAAERAAEFILGRMRDRDGRLFHRYREGEAAIPGFLDDHAFFVWGLLDLYEATFKTEYLEAALELNRLMIERFRDPDLGGFYLSASDAEPTIARTKDAADGAVPSGPSVAIMNLLRLSALTGDQGLEAEARDGIQAFAGLAVQAPAGFTHLLSALDYALGPSAEVVIVGDREAEDARRLISALRRVYAPNQVVAFAPNGGPAGPISNLAGSLRMIDGAATAYVCRGRHCQAPTTDPDQMVALLISTPGR